MSEQRITSGIAGMDVILQGGLIPGRSYLLAGATGTGKTILSLQWLLEGINKGESCQYITLAEPGGEIERNISSFGWSLEKIDLVDLTSRGGRSQTEEYHVFSPSEVELSQKWEAIYAAIESKKPDRLVIDSITFLRYLSTDEYQFRKHLLEFVNYLDASGCTTFLLYEPEEMKNDVSLALAVDGIFRLRRELSSARVIEMRSFEIVKLRGSNYNSGLHQMRITSGGIVIFPHLIEKITPIKTSGEKDSSGIAELNELLKGGLESGTATIITGPSGVGKSTLGLNFLSHAAISGKTSVLYSFEESKEFIVHRAVNTGLDVQPALDKGVIKIVHVNPMELYPDEFFHLLRNDVNDGAKIVMVDSLRGYNLAMEQFGTIIANTQNMVNFFKSRGVSVLFINEIEHITGDLMLTELGISYIADNAILLRFAEIDGKIIRVISCMKKRLGEFEPELREFQISSRGITVGTQLEGFIGTLTGVPERIK